MIRSLLVIITIASLLVEGWKIDSSCTRAGIGKCSSIFLGPYLIPLIIAADKVQDALFSAFDMAERGREALKSGHDAIRGDTVLRGPEVQRLVEHLFYKGSRSGQDRQKLYLQKVYCMYLLFL
jgi:hypothetical protein